MIDHTAILKLIIQNTELVLIQVYAPTAASSDEEMENFCKILG